MSRYRDHDAKTKGGQCVICLEHIPIEYYFKSGDVIICYECGTEYTILSKSPLKLKIWKTSSTPMIFSMNFVSMITKKVSSRKYNQKIK